MPSTSRTVNELLTDRFAATKNVDALVRHFQGAVDEYSRGEWEKSLAKAGKFLEAVLKALLLEANLPAQPSGQFKVGKAITDLGGAQTAGHVDRTIRLTVPRCCQFIYDIASNRGGRHDPDEVDANEMDATVALGNCAWVLAELIRYAQKARELTEAKSVVDGLMQRRYPFVEEIDGRVYVDLSTAKSARELGLLVLWSSCRHRMSREELVASIRRQRRNVSAKNASMAVTRLMNVVDDDGAGNLVLRRSGFREAESLIAQGQRRAS